MRKPTAGVADKSITFQVVREKPAVPEECQAGMVQVTTEVYLWPQFFYTDAAKRTRYSLYAYGLRDVARLCGIPLKVLLADVKKGKVQIWNLESLFAYCYAALSSGKYQRRWDSVVKPTSTTKRKCAYRKYRDGGYRATLVDPDGRETLIELPDPNDL